MCTNIKCVCACASTYNACMYEGWCPETIHHLHGRRRNDSRSGSKGEKSERVCRGRERERGETERVMKREIETGEKQ